MITIGEDLATGEVVIRNYLNGTVLKVAKEDIAGVVEMLREEFPQCGYCDGTRVDGYCDDCGLDAMGDSREDVESHEVPL